MTEHQWLEPTVDSLARLVPHGAMVAVPADYSGIAMELTRALIRAGVRDLHLVAVPVTGLQGEMLIGAGCVKTIETSAVTLGEYGTAVRFLDALKNGRIAIKDATCPAIHAALQAGQKDIPFMPLRGIIGSDLLAKRGDWKVIENPFATGPDPIVLLPALKPDIAIFHAPYADADGNVFIGRRRELVTMAQASRTTLVTVEEVRDDVDLMSSEETAAGALPALYVGAVAVAPRGAWPLNLWDRYPVDEAHIRQYCEMARSPEGFQRYLADVVYPRHAAE
ncbi:MAG: CoA synthetase [Alphaproteobacteria bacterium]|nr:CoA synthetase [Alphaproteobacteria bacterium]